MKFVTALCLAILMPASAVATESTGFYSTLETDAAQDCIRACAEDTLCVAWSYRGQTCGLSASAPQSVASDGALGLSPHAPAFLRAQFAAHQAALAAADAPRAPEATARHEDAVSLQLLGGPEGEDLRPQLALQR